MDQQGFSQAKVLILGCGWVGEAFAESLIAEGAEVWATTTSANKIPRLKTVGVNPLLVNMDLESGNSGITGAYDFMLTSIPASSKYTQKQIKHRFHNVRNLLNSLTFGKHIYLSSIGIYPDIDGLFDENWNEDLNERLLLAEEEMLKVKNSLVFRLGGLFGKERVFAKYFSDKVCATGSQPSNFVHIVDVVNLLKLGFLNLAIDETYNIVAPGHPSKKDVVCASAAKYGYRLPASFESTVDFQKIVSSDKVVQHLDYLFTYPNPLDF